ncbi:MAG TPA: hypothetical protein VMH00_03560 [Candidatus Limnocylindrales bacterium]|nr:hypothetical protein [Candidatus Limnocylindrales bacterium]
MASKSDSSITGAVREPAPRSAESRPAVLPEAWNFTRERWARILAVSVVLLIPCYWHREIEADDLGSHLYNAWLVQLIHRGQVHGLWIDHRWNNVLFDYLLSGFGDLFGLHVGEKIAVSLAVLIFFWGMFALVSGAAERAAWYLVPCFALFTYGWTFSMGLFNYYLAIGLSFFAIAIIWRGKHSEWLAAAAIVPLVILAHPLGFFWLLGAAVYVVAAERISPRYHFLLLLAALAGLFGVHELLWHHYVVEAQEDPFYLYSGADQLYLFGERYRIVESALLAFAVAVVAVDAIQQRHQRRFWKGYFIPLQMYALALAAVPLLPNGIRIPNHIGALALLTERLTSVSAVLLCCVLGGAKPHKWHLAASMAIAAVFFSFMYQDTGTLNKMEESIVKLVRTLPPNQRVMGTILPPDESRVSIQHMLDRACIGYCFSYGNYEPGCKMFRVRAVAGNPYVLSDYLLAVQTETGEYVVKPDDLPAYQVYQCSDETWTALCIHPLKAGERNNAVVDLGEDDDDK